MKLLNYNALKDLLLEERDKIQLTVPGARYEMNIPQPNRHGESMRAGIRIALRCMERCQPFMLDDIRPKGRWNPLPEDDRAQMIGDQCSLCGYEHFGSRFNFCPSCGAKMENGE